MTSLNKIGLNQSKSTELAHELNTLLAHYSIFYQNVRGFHWHIKGDNFFELHLKFEELYNDLVLKIDEVAERILTLGESPLHQYSSYQKISSIKESGMISNGKIAIENILESFKVLIVLQRKILMLASEIEDEGTNALMSDYIRAQEKTVWMYSSYLSK